MLAIRNRSELHSFYIYAVVQVKIGAVVRHSCKIAKFRSLHGEENKDKSMASRADAIYTGGYGDIILNTNNTCHKINGESIQWWQQWCRCTGEQRPRCFSCHEKCSPDWETWCNAVWHIHEWIPTNKSPACISVLHGVRRSRLGPVTSRTCHVLLHALMTRQLVDAVRSRKLYCSCKTVQLLSGFFCFRSRRKLCDSNIARIFPMTRTNSVPNSIVDSKNNT